MLSNKDLEILEVRKYLKWINHLEIQGLPALNEDDIWQTLTDGIVLLKLCDRIKQGCVVWSKVNDPATNSFKKIDNCGYLLTVCKELGIPSEGINPREIVQAFHKSQLNALWLIMRQSFIIIDGAKNEEEIKRLAQQFEAFANSTLICQEECEFDPLRQVLYYGEEGEVFSAFHDDEEILCPKLSDTFDKIVAEKSPENQTLFSWLRGSHFLVNKLRIHRSKPRIIANDRDYSDPPNITNHLTFNSKPCTKLKTNSHLVLDKTYTMRMNSVSSNEIENVVKFTASNRIRKNQKSANPQQQEVRQLLSTPEPVLILASPSIGMVADDIDQESLFIEPEISAKKMIQQKQSSPFSERVNILPSIQRIGSLPLSDTDSNFSASFKSSNKDRAGYSGGGSSRELDELGHSQRPAISDQSISFKKLEFELNKGVWLKDEPAPRSWGTFAEDSDHRIAWTQETILADPCPDMSTNILVSEILEEFDRSQWNKYLEPYRSILSPKPNIKNPRDRKSETHAEVNEWFRAAKGQRLASQPYYLRIESRLIPPALGGLDKIHPQFLGSHYDQVFGRSMVESEYVHNQKSNDSLSSAKLFCSKLSDKVQNSHLRSFLRMLEGVSTSVQLSSVVASTEPANLLLKGQERILFRRLSRLSQEQSQPKLMQLVEPSVLLQKREYLSASVLRAWDSTQVRAFYKLVLVRRMTEDPRLTLRHETPAWRLLETWLSGAELNKQQSH